MVQKYVLVHSNEKKYKLIESRGRVVVHLVDLELDRLALGLDLHGVGGCALGRLGAQERDDVGVVDDLKKIIMSLQEHNQVFK